ncbi:MAG: hypothetical protein CL878_13815 [Dehalococcoidia bacterium]|nr:hypothetical protein [Dehalococcoidia bacterium]
MLTDIWTVMWKERKERSRQQESLRDEVTNWFAPLLLLGLLAIRPPVEVGPDWVTSPFSLLGSITVPLMWVGMTIADSFAGERERHTLETLLASRLPDRAILFGKLGVPVLDAVGITLVVHLVSLTALNVVHWDGTLMLYTPTIALANLGVSFLLAMLVASLGVFFSLRAATAKQAAQHLMMALLSPLSLLVLLLLYVGAFYAISWLGTVLPATWRAALARFFEGIVVTTQPFFEGIVLTVQRFFEGIVLTANFTQVLLLVIALLVVVDVGLVRAALARCQRARLLPA